MKVVANAGPLMALSKLGLVRLLYQLLSGSVTHWYVVCGMNCRRKSDDMLEVIPTLDPAG